MTNPKRKVVLTETQIQCLKALIKVLEDGEPGFYTPFQPICKRTGLDRKTVRKAIRALARKGFAEYEKGLCDYDGEFRGAGYRPTETGITYPTPKKKKR